MSQPSNSLEYRYIRHIYICHWVVVMFSCDDVPSTSDASVPWFLHNFAELDICSTRILPYGDDMDPDTLVSLQ